MATGRAILCCKRLAEKRRDAPGSKVPEHRVFSLQKQLEKLNALQPVVFRFAETLARNFKNFRAGNGRKHRRMRGEKELAAVLYRVENHQTQRVLVFI